MKLILRQVLCNKGLCIFIIHNTKFIFVILWYPKLICGNSAGARGWFVSNHDRVWEQENINYF
jgi:hypothetical protein